MRARGALIPPNALVPPPDGRQSRPGQAPATTSPPALPRGADPGAGPAATSRGARGSAVAGDAARADAGRHGIAAPQVPRGAAGPSPREKPNPATATNTAAIGHT